MRVLLSGYYGFGNHGDEALLAGLIRGLRDHGHEPSVLSADPASTRRLHGVPAHARIRGLVPALLATDALVSGGGGLLQDATSGRSLAYYLGVIRLARLLRKTTIVYGQSVGPLTARGRSWVRYGLEGIPVAVRDRPSEQLLAELGIPTTRTTDAALLAFETPPADVSAHARDEGAERGAVLFVPRAGYPEHTAALAEVASRLAHEGIEVQALALHPDQDTSAAESIQRSANGDRPIVPPDHRASFARLARARVVVSARLHGLVFAAAAGVRHVGLVYDPKVAGFLEDSGGAAFVAPFDVDGLFRAVCDAPPLDPERLRVLEDRARAGMRWLDARLRAPHAQHE